MKNRRQTILTATLDLAVDYATSVELDVPVTYTYSTQSDGTANTKTLYPKEIQVVNGTGSELEWIIIASADEYVEYQADQTNFDFVRLPSGQILQDDSRSLQRAYKFIVRKNTFGVLGTVTADLCVEFLSYGEII